MRDAIEKEREQLRSRISLLQLIWNLNRIGLIKVNLCRCLKTVCPSIRQLLLLSVHFFRRFAQNERSLFRLTQLQRTARTPRFSREPNLRWARRYQHLRCLTCTIISTPLWAAVCMPPATGTKVGGNRVRN